MIYETHCITRKIMMTFLLLSSWTESVTEMWVFYLHFTAGQPYRAFCGPVQIEAGACGKVARDFGLSQGIPVSFTNYHRLVTT